MTAPAEENAESPNATEDSPAEETAGVLPAQPPNRDVPLVVEVLAVLCLAVFPHIASALLIASRQTNAFSLTFEQQHLRLIVISLQIAAPLLMIMALSRCDWKEHGFSVVRPRADTGWMILLLVANYVAVQVALYLYFAFVPVAEHAYDDSFIASADNAGVQLLLLLIVSMMFNAFAEELAMRSYLIPNLLKLTESKASAVLLSSLFFGIYHLYQGAIGFVCSFVIGLVFGTWFIHVRRIWPIVAAHAVWDIIVLMPYLNIR